MFRLLVSFRQSLADSDAICKEIGHVDAQTAELLFDGREVYVSRVDTLLRNDGVEGQAEVIDDFVPAAADADLGTVGC